MVTKLNRKSLKALGKSGQHIVPGRMQEVARSFLSKMARSVSLVYVMNWSETNWAWSLASWTMTV